MPEDGSAIHRLLIDERGGVTLDWINDKRAGYSSRDTGAGSTRGDHWWVIAGRESVEAVSRDVAEAWRVFGRPWLDTNATLAGARAELTRRDALHGAVASMLLGDRIEAERLLRTFLAECPETARIARARAERWAVGVGLEAGEQGR